MGQIVTEGASSPYHHSFFQNGVFRKELVHGFVQQYGWPPESLQLIEQHPLYDSLWGAVDLGSRPEQVRWPVVLLFTTPRLAEPLEVTGRITVHLTAATSARDTDFTARLTDVYPDGRSMLVTEGILRASYRNSLQRAEFLTPGQRYTFDIDVGSTSLIFNRGHRIRVAISSSNYPRFEANRNNGRSWPTDQNFPAVVAHQTIVLGGTDGSHIVLPEIVGAAG